MRSALSSFASSPCASHAPATLVLARQHGEEFVILNESTLKCCSNACHCNIIMGRTQATRSEDKVTRHGQFPHSACNGIYIVWHYFDSFDVNAAAVQHPTQVMGIAIANLSIQDFVSYNDNASRTHWLSKCLRRFRRHLLR